MARTMPRKRVSGFFGEFKEFITNGNVMDLAVAVILGAAFGKIIESLVKDVITPLILSPALEAAQVDKLENLVIGNGVAIGLFLAAIINFLIIAFSIFVIVKLLEQAKRKTARAEALAEPEVDVQAQLVDSINRLNATIASKV